MAQSLICDHQLVVGKETVKQLLKIIDLEGVELQGKHRLRSRQYANKGPNHLWHMEVDFSDVMVFSCSLTSLLNLAIQEIPCTESSAEVNKNDSF